MGLLGHWGVTLAAVSALFTVAASAAPSKNSGHMNHPLRALLQGLNVQPIQPGWFSNDAEKMDELPNYSGKEKCHPKCHWNCGSALCDDKCKPACKPPKCATACEQVDMTMCKRTCEEPKCMVVCPKKNPCESGECPACTTVCDKPKCTFACKGSFCQSQCSAPVCEWQCDPSGCPEPACQLECEDPKHCGLGDIDKNTGSATDEAQQEMLNGAVFARALAKVPKDNSVLVPAQQETMKAPQMLKGGKLIGGAVKYEAPAPAPAPGSPVPTPVAIRAGSPMF